jgi:small subunit ribosomal protein S17
MTEQDRPAADANVSDGVSRGQQRILVGVVLSTKMDKTVTVVVTRRVQHTQYQKYQTRRTRYMAHDEKNACQAGDRVEIASCRPLSRHKRWRVQRIVERPA